MVGVWVVVVVVVVVVHQEWHATVQRRPGCISKGFPRSCRAGQQPSCAAALYTSTVVAPFQLSHRQAHTSHSAMHKAPCQLHWQLALQAEQSPWPALPSCCSCAPPPPPPHAHSPHSPHLKSCAMVVALIIVFWLYRSLSSRRSLTRSTTSGSRPLSASASHTASHQGSGLLYGCEAWQHLACVCLHGHRAQHVDLRCGGMHVDLKSAASAVLLSNPLAASRQRTEVCGRIALPCCRAHRSNSVLHTTLTLYCTLH